MVIEILRMAIFHSYVSLPEGMTIYSFIAWTRTLQDVIASPRVRAPDRETHERPANVLFILSVKRISSRERHEYYSLVNLG